MQPLNSLLGASVRNNAGSSPGYRPYVDPTNNTGGFLSELNHLEPYVGSGSHCSFTENPINGNNNNSVSLREIGPITTFPNPRFGRFEMLGHRNSKELARSILSAIKRSPEAKPDSAVQTALRQYLGERSGRNKGWDTLSPIQKYTKCKRVEQYLSKHMTALGYDADTISVTLTATKNALPWCNPDDSRDHLIDLAREVSTKGEWSFALELVNVAKGKADNAEQIKQDDMLLVDICAEAIEKLSFTQKSLKKGYLERAFQILHHYDDPCRDMTNAESFIKLVKLGWSIDRDAIPEWVLFRAPEVVIIEQPAIFVSRRDTFTSRRDIFASRPYTFTSKESRLVLNILRKISREPARHGRSTEYERLGLAASAIGQTWLEIAFGLLDHAKTLGSNTFSVAAARAYSHHYCFSTFKVVTLETPESYQWAFDQAQSPADKAWACHGAATFKHQRALGASSETEWNKLKNEALALYSVALELAPQKDVFASNMRRCEGVSFSYLSCFDSHTGRSKSVFNASGEYPYLDPLPRFALPEKRVNSDIPLVKGVVC